MPLVVKDFAFEEGQTNLGGTKGKAYYVPASHIATFTPAPEGDATIATAITLKSGKRWAEIYYTRDTGSIVDTEVGEMDGGSFETNIEFFCPKINNDLLVLKRIFSNGGFVFVMKDGNDVVRLIGTPELPAFRVAKEVNGGKAPKDRNGASFAFNASGATPAPIYPFAIALTPTV